MHRIPTFPRTILGPHSIQKDLLRQENASLSLESLPHWLERDTYGMQGPQRVGSAEHLFRRVYLNMGSNAISTAKSLVSWSVARGRTSVPNLTLSATRSTGEGARWQEVFFLLQMGSILCNSTTKISSTLQAFLSTQQKSHPH